MKDLLTPDDIVVRSWTHARPEELRRGVVGWLQIELFGVAAFDSVALRRTQGGRLRLALPRRRDRRGVEHDIVILVNSAVRETIEQAVLQQLRTRGALPW